MKDAPVLHAERRKMRRERDFIRLRLKLPDPIVVNCPIVVVDLFKLRFQELDVF